MSAQITGLTQMVTLLLAERGLTAPSQPMTNQASSIVNASSPVANPHSLFVGSQQPVTTAPRAASNDQPIIHQIEEVDTHYSHS